MAGPLCTHVRVPCHMASVCLLPREWVGEGDEEDVFSSSGLDDEVNMHGSSISAHSMGGGTCHSTGYH